MTVTSNAGSSGAYGAQVVGRAAELLPGIDTAERLELRGLMDPDDMRTSLAWLAAAYPNIFDFSLVRDPVRPPARGPRSRAAHLPARAQERWARGGAVSRQFMMPGKTAVTAVRSASAWP